MASTQITQELQDGILTITLNRPEKLNAFTAEMGSALADAFRAADENDAVRVVIVTGAGRGFCAGADISSGSEAFGKGGDNLFGKSTGPRSESSFIESIFNCRKPSIAAINGAAVGVGLTLTLPMDIRIATTDARFGFIFARRGLVPEAGSAWFLPRLVGLPQALRWCYSGRVFDAEEALKGGLIDESVPAEALLVRAREIAAEISAETAPVSIALTRQLLWRFASAPDPTELLGIDSKLNRALGASADVREGVSAFLEKRKPKFPGRVSRDMPPPYPWWDED
jgi:enoyl-CoA hydratase/carnithine racemase